VAGLLEKALRIRSAQGGEGEAEVVSGEERQKILDDIEILFRTQRPHAQDRRQGKRLNGLALPVAANVVGILFVAACILAFVLSGAGSFGTVGRGASANLAAEGLIIEQVRHEAGEALSERERRIAEIQAELDRLSQARQVEALARTASPQPGLSRSVEAQEEALKAELAALQAASAVSLADLDRRRAQTDFLLSELRGIYAESRSLAAKGQFAEAREQAASGAAIVRQLSASDQGLQELAPLLNEGSAALDEVLRIAAAQPSSADAAAMAERLREIDLEREGLRNELEGMRRAMTASEADRAALDAAQRQARARMAQLEKQAAELSLALSDRIRQDEERRREYQLAFQRLEAALAEAPSYLSGKGAANDELILSILEEKLELREEAAARSALKPGTGFYDKLDRYLADIAAAEHREGEEDALRQAALALRRLRESLGPAPGTSADSATGEGTADSSGIDAAQAYLEELDRLLETLLAARNDD